MDTSGNLYGTADGGGAEIDGTVFELSPVPEPSTFVLAVLAALMLNLIAATRRRPSTPAIVSA